MNLKRPPTGVCFLYGQHLPQDYLSLTLYYLSIFWNIYAISRDTVIISIYINIWKKSQTTIFSSTYVHFQYDLRRSECLLPIKQFHTKVCWLSSIIQNPFQDPFVILLCSALKTLGGWPLGYIVMLASDWIVYVRSICRTADQQVGWERLRYSFLAYSLLRQNS